MSTQGNNLTAIANAIRAKDGTSAPIVANDFAARIAAIPTGSQLPALTNPGTAGDLASGKQLIDQNGEIVTGVVSVTSKSNPLPSIYSNLVYAYSTIYVNGLISQDSLARVGAVAQVPVPSHNFGNATAADVAAGKTFTSAAGVNVEGTAQIGSGVYYESTSVGAPGIGVKSLSFINYPFSSLPKLVSVFPATSSTTAANYIDSLIVLSDQKGICTGANFKNLLTTGDFEIGFNVDPDDYPTKFVVSVSGTILTVYAPVSEPYFFDAGVTYLVAASL